VERRVDRCPTYSEYATHILGSNVGQCPDTGADGRIVASEPNPVFRCSKTPVQMLWKRAKFFRGLMTRREDPWGHHKVASRAPTTIRCCHQRDPADAYLQRWRLVKSGELCAIPRPPIWNSYLDILRPFLTADDPGHVRGANSGRHLARYCQATSIGVGGRVASALHIASIRSASLAG
jgi:hypothetical protein